MFLSRLVLDPRSRDVLRDLSDGQDLHRTLMRAFGQAPDSRTARDHFGLLYRLEATPDGRPAVLVESLVEPHWSSLPNGYLAADPAVKPMAALLDALSPGARLRFRLVASPTRSVPSSPIPGGKRARGAKQPIFDQVLAVAWLNRRLADAGADLVGNPILTPVDPMRGSRAAAYPLTVSGFRFDGMCLVRDPEVLRTAIVEGIGPGKAYGFGLLTVATA